MAVCMAYAYLRAKSIGLSNNAIYDVGLLSVVFGLLGARAFYLYFDHYPVGGIGNSHAEWFEIGQGGLSFYGGLGIGLIAATIYLKIKKVSLAQMADIYAIPLTLGLAVGKIGCLLNGCCWGKISPKWFPWGMYFPEETDVMSKQWIDFGDKPEVWDELMPQLGYLADATPELPVYPTQIISMAGLLFVAAGLMFVEKWGKNRIAGQIFVLFIAAYSIGRFFSEFLRDDTPNVLGWSSFPGLHSGQWLSLMTLAFAVIAQIHLKLNSTRALNART
jgi:phosphatidylglycerol:prolipoprotein diacylglycerol transferase